MTPCVGWAGPCPTHGRMHGCRHADGHRGNWHECDCGDRRRAGRGEQRPLNVCGTDAGYVRHLRANQIACLPCRAAHAAVERYRRRDGAA